MKFFRRRLAAATAAAGDDASSAAVASPRAADGAALPAASPSANHQTRRAQTTMICRACRAPILPTERRVRTTSTLESRNHYHHDRCFVCAHCGVLIDPLSQSYCYAKKRRRRGKNVGGDSNSGGRGEDNCISSSDNDRRDERDDEEEYPFHGECYARHHGWVCVVCENPLPMVTKNDRASGGGESSNVEYLKHPFFETERMCPHHATVTAAVVDGSDAHCNNANNASTQQFTAVTTPAIATTDRRVGRVRRCAGCHRFEPALPTKHFVDVGDGDTGRCVCLACCRTLVTTSDDALPLWSRVLDFFEGLGLFEADCKVGEGSGAPTARGVTRGDMQRIPILIVGTDALDDGMRRVSASEGGRHHHHHYGSDQIMTRGLCLSERCVAGGGIYDGKGSREVEVGVTAVLCLGGLPADLTASILAHGERFSLPGLIFI